MPTSFGDYLTPGVFNFLGGSVGEFVGQVAYIRDELKAKKVGVLVLNVPQATSAAEALVKAPLATAGITATIVPTDPAATDYTPALTAIMRDNPDVITVLNTGAPCGQILQARGALGITTPTLFPSACSDAAFIEAGGSGADGVIFSMETLLPALFPDDPEVKTFTAAMKEFADVEGDAITAYAQSSFVNIYNVGQVLNEVKGDITPAAVLATTAASKNHDSPMAGEYTCDGSVQPTFPTICNAAIWFVQRDGDTWKSLSDDWFRGS